MLDTRSSGHQAPINLDLNFGHRHRRLARSTAVAAWLGPWVLFSFIVAGLNWPLLAQLSTHVIGGPRDDYLEVLYLLDWTEKAVFGEDSPMFAPNVFFPRGWYVAAAAHPVWWLVLLAPLTHIFQPTLTYNIAVLASFVIAARGVYLLAIRVTGQRLPSVLAACIFITAPVLTFRPAGHLNILLSAMWLPYLALASLKSLDVNSRSKFPAWAAGSIYFALSVLGHWQFLFISPLIPVCVIAFERSGRPLWERCTLLLRMAVVALLLLLPCIIIAQDARARTYDLPPKFSMVDADAESFSLDRLFVPNPLHPLWRSQTRQWFSIEGEGSLGSIPYNALLLAVVGILLGRTRRAGYIALTVVSILLALGITLHWNLQPLVISRPSPVVQVLRSLDQILLDPELVPVGNEAVIPMPIAALFGRVPMLCNTRAWGRYLIAAMLGVAVLAACGASLIGIRRGRGGHIIVSILIAMTLFEGMTAPYESLQRVSDNTRTVDRWLSELPIHVTILEYPLPQVNVSAMYAQSLHDQSVVNGHSSHFPTYYAHAQHVFGEWPNAGAVDMLRQFSVDAVLVNGTSDEHFQNEILPAIRSLPGLCWVKKFEDSLAPFTEVHVFAVLGSGELCDQPAAS